MHEYITIIIAALVALAAVRWIFMKVLRIAKVKDLVDKPNSRKFQDSPVPILGGISVFFGVALGMIVYVALQFFAPAHTEINLLPMLLGGCVMMYLGAMDDIEGLSPGIRLLFEMFVMLGMIFMSGKCVDSLQGLWGIWDFSWYWAVPLTVVAGVGLVNAYNMVDGVNGLSSGLCILAGYVITFFLWKVEDYDDCALAACFATALIPFYMHNVFGSRSKMFIGDAGTMVMGLIAAWFTIMLLSSDSTVFARLNTNGRHAGIVAMALCIFSVPVFDTLRVMVMRMLRGGSPFKADRTHLHHVFIRIGMGHFLTSSCEVLMNAFIIACGYIAYANGASAETQLYVVVGASAALVWGSYFVLTFIGRRYSYDTVTQYTRVPKSLIENRWWKKMTEMMDKGAYEDYVVLYGKKTNKQYTDMDCKEMDTAAVMNFMYGKKAVDVKDIIEASVAEEMRVYIILFELEQKGLLTVLKRDLVGTPTSVCIKAGKVY